MGMTSGEGGHGESDGALRVGCWFVVVGVAGSEVPVP